MKKILLLLTTLFLNFETYSQEGTSLDYLLPDPDELNLKKLLNFTLTCKVTDQTIFLVKEGKSQRFNEYTNGLSNGDAFDVNFEINHNSEEFDISILSADIGLLGIYRSESVYVSENLNGYFNFNSSGFLNSDLFHIEGFGKARARFERYYKNDWQLISTSNLHEQSQRMLAANCMNMPSEFDEMMEIVNEITDKKLDARNE